MPFSTKDDDVIFEILEDFNDEIVLNIERDEENGKEFIEFTMELPEEAYQKFGPESVEVLRSFISRNPHEFLEYFFPGDIEELEWGEIENQHMSIREENGKLKIAINIYCKIEDY